MNFDAGNFHNAVGLGFKAGCFKVKAYDGAGQIECTCCHIAPEILRAGFMPAYDYNHTGGVRRFFLRKALRLEKSGFRCDLQVRLAGFLGR